MVPLAGEDDAQVECRLEEEVPALVFFRVVDRSRSRDTTSSCRWKASKATSAAVVVDNPGRQSWSLTNDVNPAADIVRTLAGGVEAIGRPV
ncbi:hypothetical protein [Pseudonocardia acidicola]|uniref:Uncharacterized protein n=1 Tax=Pseudonocardia acidicola TaxID=2724939 RepID=A0ABX1SA13_9PSEU|nr:hypothetical protein [Pseudonocardia acidicola]NMH98410.1 hypothetical protein [Pseudonocardia acidicola]